MVLGGIAMALLLILIGDMIYEVVSRRVFGAPTLWAYDIAYMTNGAGFILAAGYALRHNAHIRIDFLSTRLPLTVQDWLNVIVYLVLVLPALSLIVYGAYVEWLEAFQTDELEPASPWKPLIWPLFAVILIGFSAFLLQTVAQCIRHVQSALGRGTSPLTLSDDGSHG